MQICGRGEGTMGADLKVAGCPSTSLPWAECSVDRSDAAGVANARTRARNIARGLAKRLKKSWRVVRSFALIGMCMVHSR